MLRRYNIEKLYNNSLILHPYSPIALEHKRVLLLSLLLLGSFFPVYAENGEEEEQTIPTGTEIKFPVGVSDSTLAVVVGGGIAGAFMRNLTGYLGATREAKARNQAEPKYNAGNLLRTALFAMPVGTITAIGFTSLLEIDVTGNFVRGFVLFWIVVALTIGIDKLKADTVSK